MRRKRWEGKDEKGKMRRERWERKDEKGKMRRESWEEKDKKGKMRKERWEGKGKGCWRKVVQESFESIKTRIYDILSRIACAGKSVWELIVYKKWQYFSGKKVCTFLLLQNFIIELRQEKKETT